VTETGTACPGCAEPADSQRFQESSQCSAIGRDGYVSGNRLWASDHSAAAGGSHKDIKLHKALVQ